jgi:bifunctional non-homologous end joining protein LigD
MAGRPKQLAQDSTPVAGSALWLADCAHSSNVRHHDPVPPDVLPMLADRSIPRSLDGWSAEPKLDGWRARVLADDGQVRLRTRSGRDISSSVRSIDRLADRRVVLDGELVADAGRMEDFYRVGPALARRCQVSFVAFDVLWLDGELLIGRPQSERRRILDELGLPVPVIPSFAYDEAPLLFEACGQLGVEGIVLKQLTAPYRPGQRSPAWRKVKVRDWRPHFERRTR